MKRGILWVGKQRHGVAVWPKPKAMGIFPWLYYPDIRVYQNWQSEKNYDSWAMLS